MILIYLFLGAVASGALWWAGWPYLAAATLAGFAAGAGLLLRRRPWAYRLVAALAERHPQLQAILPDVALRRYQGAMERATRLGCRYTVGPDAEQARADVEALCRFFHLLSLPESAPFESELLRFVMLDEQEPTRDGFWDDLVAAPLDVVEDAFRERDRMLSRCLRWLESPRGAVRNGADEILYEMTAKVCLGFRIDAKWRAYIEDQPALGPNDTGVLVALKLLQLPSAAAAGAALSFLERPDLGPPTRDRDALLHLARVRKDLDDLSADKIRTRGGAALRETALLFLVEDACCAPGGPLFEPDEETYSVLEQALTRKRAFIEEGIRLLASYPHQLGWLLETLLASLTGLKRRLFPSPARWIRWWKQNEATFGALQSRLLEAGRALEEGNPDRAAQIYRSILVSSPKDRRVLTALAVSREKAGDTAEARTILTGLLHRDPRDTAIQHKLGQLEYAAGDAERALWYFERIVAKEPAHTSARCWVGKIEAERGNLRRAEESFRRAHEADPSNGFALASLVEFLIRSDRQDEADSLLSGLGLSDPDSALGLYRLHRERGNQDAARDQARRLLEHPPEDPDLLEDLWLLLEEDGHYEEASRLRETIVRLRAERGEL